jgi:hypothetical protein
MSTKKYYNKKSICMSCIHRWGGLTAVKGTVVKKPVTCGNKEEATTCRSNSNYAPDITIPESTPTTPESIGTTKKIYGCRVEKRSLAALKAYAKGVEKHRAEALNDLLHEALMDKAAHMPEVAAIMNMPNSAFWEETKYFQKKKK